MLISQVDYPRIQDISQDAPNYGDDTLGASAPEALPAHKRNQVPLSNAVRNKPVALNLD